MRPPFETDYFVCHASSDGVAAAQEIVAALEANGVKCWIAPRDIPLGVTWASAIVSGIENSRAILLIVSKKSVESDEIEREVTLAAYLRKPIFPIRVAEVALSGALMYQVQSRQWRDYFASKDGVIREIVAEAKSKRDLVDVIAPLHSDLAKTQQPAFSPSRLLDRRAVVSLLALCAAAGGYALYRRTLPFEKGLANRSEDSTHVAASETPIDDSRSIPGIVGGRSAIVVGNGHYHQGIKLDNPTRDAQAVASVLQEIGFSVALNLDVEQARADLLVEQLRSSSVADDWVLFYYAGHAVSLGGANYLVPIDSKVGNVADIEQSGLKLETVIEAIQGARQVSIAIIDACRDSPFGPVPSPNPVRGLCFEDQGECGTPSRTKVDPIQTPRGLSPVTKPSSRIVVYSTSEGGVALDGTGNLSPFADAFVRRIRQRGIEIDKAFRQIRDDVSTATGGMQIPTVYSSIGAEDLYFNPARKP